MTRRDIAFGALAGVCATMAMTVTMRQLWEHLPPAQRYPLPPREITQRSLPATGAGTALLAHFGYGALTGALYACLPPRARPAGILYGPAVWAASYFGWVPGARILTPAHHHPAARNALMIAAHAVWGAALTSGIDELQSAARHGFGPGPLRDARPQNERSLHA
jgi:hypothetical protein